MTRATLLGVDGGGTSTTAWLADPDGKVLGRGESGPSNIQAIGPDAARAGLERSIRAAFDDARLEIGPVDVACLGLAGFGRPEDARWLEAWAGGTPWGRRLLLVNDGDLVVAAGTPEGWGVGVIAGTGSIAVGRGRDGRSSRAGGWGYLLGDEGSAYAVALAGLRLVARRADGRARFDGGIPGSLTFRICQALGIASPSGLVAAIHGRDFDRSRVAALAPAVVAAARVDRSIATEILEPAGLDLAEMVASAARPLDLGGSGVLPLAMAGNFLLNCEDVSLTLIERLGEMGYEVRPRAVTEPVAGALVLAGRALRS